MIRLLFMTAALATASPAVAQHQGHDAPPGEEPADPHAGHALGSMPADSHAAMVSAPAAANEHAADALFDPAEMARSREALRREHGAFSGSMIRFDLAEYQARKGQDGYRWEAEGWFGGDINRLLIKSEAQGTFGAPLEAAELQLLYSRAVAPYWNAHIGARRDIGAGRSMTDAVIGVEGMAPYWFHLSGQVFLSDKGDLRARLEGSYDMRITQRLILSPRAELALSAQDMPSARVGPGVTDLELGLRLHYEIRREFAPYMGAEWSRKFAATARYAQLAGEAPDAVNFVAGIRFWL